VRGCEASKVRAPRDVEAYSRPDEEPVLCGSSGATAADRDPDRPASAVVAAVVPVMPRVVNLRGRRGVVPEGAAYIGRAMPRIGLAASKWANPFKIGHDGSRDEVIAKYRAYLLQHPSLMAALPELRGKDLACWCAPERCHGDVLLELIQAAYHLNRN
jgi:hypothetical protein